MQAAITKLQNRIVGLKTDTTDWQSKLDVALSELANEIAAETDEDCDEFAPEHISEPSYQWQATLHDFDNNRPHKLTADDQLVLAKLPSLRRCSRILLEPINASYSGARVLFVRPFGQQGDHMMPTVLKINKAEK